jgi:hypothetical protein
MCSSGFAPPRPGRVGSVAALQHYRTWKALLKPRSEAVGPTRRSRAYIGASRDECGSEALLDASLLQDGVGGVSGLDLPIHRKVAARDRAEPDFVITFELFLNAWPVEAAAMRLKDFLELRRIVRHQMWRGAAEERLATTSNGTLVSSSPGYPFKSNNSGTMIFTCR